MPSSPAAPPANAPHEQVVLVDETDTEVGTLEKQRAHVEGRLHRALSVFVFNRQGEILLQRRAGGKYHSGGQWTNTCCSHPRPGEPVAAAAHRRLREEMGFECDLSLAFAFTYRADVGGGLVEHEFDHVFVGRWEGEPAPDADEVDGWRWASLDDLTRDAALHPDAYTPWFRMVLADQRWREGLERATGG